MDDEELEKIRQKRMKEKYNQMEERAQLDQQMSNIAKQFLKPKAYERLMNVKISNPELYNQVIRILASYGPRLKNKMSEKELIELLKNMLPEKRETKIHYKRKGGINGK